MNRSNPAPPEVPPDLTPDERAHFLQLHGKAYNLRHRSVAAYLSGALLGALPAGLDPPAVSLYLNQLLADAGDPQDPIEQMLIEQLVLVHHALGRLHLRAAESQVPAEIEAYSASIARLFAEFRRASLALKEYRAPIVAKNVTVVGQQNVAQNQQVAMLGSKASPPASKRLAPAKEKPALTELRSNDDLQFLNSIGKMSEPQASSCRTSQPVATERSVLSRPGSSKSIDSDSPAVASLNGSADR